MDLTSVETQYVIGHIYIYDMAYLPSL